MERFEAFSALHFATVAAFALLWAAFALAGRALAGGPRLPAWRAGLALWVLACWLFANGVQLLPAHFRADVVLPLQVCDIAGLLAAFALWRPGRHMGALLHFWGLGFSVQAILTPELLHGPGHVDYWTFWLPHANLTGAACYALVAEGYRPRWSDARLAFCWALAYLALILPFDLATGFNYGYVGPAKPLNASLMDWLGPWPWRIAVMVLLTAAVFALLALPWARREAQKPRSRA
jgi:hypothetical integral membrane protein (TIGR02206 family)